MDRARSTPHVVARRAGAVFVYELGTRAFGLPAGDILFVSSNGWDVAGAKAFGYRACWCNRLGAPMENLGVTPDLEVRRLDEIVTRLG